MDHGIRHFLQNFSSQQRDRRREKYLMRPSIWIPRFCKRILLQRVYIVYIEDDNERERTGRMNFSSASPSRHTDWYSRTERRGNPVKTRVRWKRTVRWNSRWWRFSVEARACSPVLGCETHRANPQASRGVHQTFIGPPRSEWSLGTLESKQRLPSCQLFSSSGSRFTSIRREHLPALPIESNRSCPLTFPQTSSFLIGSYVRTRSVVRSPVSMFPQLARNVVSCFYLERWAFSATKSGESRGKCLSLEDVGFRIRWRCKYYTFCFLSPIRYNIKCKLNIGMKF